MNPRYLAYCRAHAMTPEEQMSRDKTEYPGGCMCGFILWSGAQLNEFAHLSGTAVQWIDHDAYDRWLNAQFPII